MFATLDELDERLADRRFLFGSAPVETDWRLFTTLVRFDAVYQIHFKCSLRKLIEYEHLWPYTRDLYQWPGVADTVDFDEIRRHYYLTHPMINPSGLVAVRPAASFDLPHGRESLSVSGRRATRTARSIVRLGPVPNHVSFVTQSVDLRMDEGVSHDANPGGKTGLPKGRRTDMLLEREPELHRMRRGDPATLAAALADWS